ncbi:23S rRNA (adenine(2503)-C(2))-methyltransferase RlmN [Mongoliitalea lutea]|uniref:Probable dual-specificity RNA methyltransferase RlmN n=1 Tax=Mongoliitalea lutea TaxID=849756 RepID=A0A8J3CZ12_9BACT|nr:23S rRNA (adenine(2503)-C(2))-methyltransferase RlmN [Mongoliitalea lutea]GHB37828.1 putative dual-specificity RNA methyltransferase RlmN [Mongoliitalea lutea]
MEQSKKDIRKFSLQQLEEFFVTQGDKKFRAKQVYDWLWNKSLKNFDDMSNISKETREMLKDNFSINHVKVDLMQHSTDGTIKNAVKLHDGKIVESVLIPTTKRITACVSSQVGCSLDCNFCATARLKRMRNLNPDEIYDQVVAIKEEAETYFNRPLTNIVFMGMGEPLLNYANVVDAIDKITSPEGLGMAPRRITLSTVGIPKMIRKMADDEVKFNLAISLHSAINETRSRLMPINDVNPLEDLADSLRYWYQKTKRKVTYEYVIWDGINDDEAHAKALAKFCKIIPSKVNIIQYNPIDEGEFRQAKQEAVDMYIRILEGQGIIAKVRKSRGQDIDAACGQLANKNEVAELEGNIPLKKS